MVIEPGSVTIEGRALSGSFMVRRASPGLDSIGTGGACLIADLRAAGIGGMTCDVDADCAAPARFAGGAAYCTRPPGSDEPRSCWVRPGSQQDYCTISLTLPLPLDQRIPLPEVALRPLRGARPLRWMVYACLNGRPLACKERRSDRMAVAGDALTLP